MSEKPFTMPESQHAPFREYKSHEPDEKRLRDALTKIKRIAEQQGQGFANAEIIAICAENLK